MYQAASNAITRLSRSESLVMALDTGLVNVVYGGGGRPVLLASVQTNS